MKNIFYFRNISEIGGIETFFYQLAKKYSKNDITIYYSIANLNQLNRLKQYVRVKQYKGEHIECEKSFFNFNLDIIDNVTAKEYIQILHGDYINLGICPQTHPKITKYLAVSEAVKNSFEEIGITADVAYNPITVEKPKKMLNLISATRLSSEKGKGRIEKLAKIFDENEIPYQWLIFTSDKNEIDNPNIIYMKPRLDITNFVANADYLVQLSDSEGYCYSVVEALSVGTPVIVTDIPVMKEIGVNKSNGFILDFDLEKVPVKDIYEKNLTFKYTPKKDTWDKILAKGKTTYKPYKVRATNAYKQRNVCDTELEFRPDEGYEFIVDEERFKVLSGENKFKIKFVELAD